MVTFHFQNDALTNIYTLTKHMKLVVSTFSTTIRVQFRLFFSIREEIHYKWNTQNIKRIWKSLSVNYTPSGLFASWLFSIFSHTFFSVFAVHLKGNNTSLVTILRTFETQEVCNKYRHKQSISHVRYNFKLLDKFYINIIFMLNIFLYPICHANFISKISVTRAEDSISRALLLRHSVSVFF